MPRAKSAVSKTRKTIEFSDKELEIIEFIEAEEGFSNFSETVRFIARLYFWDRYSHLSRDQATRTPSTNSASVEAEPEPPTQQN